MAKSILSTQDIVPFDLGSMMRMGEERHASPRQYLPSYFSLHLCLTATKPSETLTQVAAESVKTSKTTPVGVRQQDLRGVAKATKANRDHYVNP